jgi:hypothetical protein
MESVVRMRIELYQFTGIGWCSACNQQIKSADYPINALKDHDHNFLFHLGCDPRVHPEIRDRVYGKPGSIKRQPNNFIPGYQSPKQQAEYNTLAMDALYDRIIDFLCGDPLLYDSNDGSITARILTAETVYHPTTYQPHGVLITLKDAKRTQYMLRIERADLAKQLPAGETIVEAQKVEQKQLPSGIEKEEYNGMLDPTPIIDIPAIQAVEEPRFKNHYIPPIADNEVDLLISLSRKFRQPKLPHYWRVLPVNTAGRPLYDISYTIGKCPSVQNAIDQAYSHLDTNPDHRVIILEGYSV